MGEGWLSDNSMYKGWSEKAMIQLQVSHIRPTQPGAINTADHSAACTHGSLPQQLHQSDVFPGSAPALGHVQTHAVDERSVGCGAA